MNLNLYLELQNVRRVVPDGVYVGTWKGCTVSFDTPDGPFIGETNLGTLDPVPCVVKVESGLYSVLQSESE